MKNCNLDDKNDDVCEVFDSHEDVVNRIKGRIPDEDEFSQLSDFFKIFGNPTRLKIISLLCLEDLCVCDICEALDLNQTTVSNQLRILKNAKLVKGRKKGKEVYYSLDDDHVSKIFECALEHIYE